jgi:hypothetical protein
VLVKTFLVFCDGSVVLFADIVNKNDAVLRTAGNQIRVLDTELTSCDFALRVKDLFRKGGVFKGPKHEQTSSSTAFRSIITVREFVGDS